MATRELGPASLAVVQAVEASLNPGDRRLIVACSGGADSLALAFATAHVARRQGRAWAAVTVDHGLQPGSADQAGQVRTQLLGLGYRDVQIATVSVDPGSPAGPEAAARAARSTVLESAAQAEGGTVLLGHTLDDQAETVLLGLARGSGLRSLAGMAPRVRHLLRPLLTVRRRTTEQVCAEQGLAVWTDPHNADPRFTRARVRSVVLPTLEAELGPGIAEALVRTAVLAREDADLLERLAAEADPGTDDLPAAALLDLPRALRTRLIRRWLLRHGAAEIGLHHVRQVEALVTHWHGQGPINLPDLTVRRLRGQLQILR